MNLLSKMKRVKIVVSNKSELNNALYFLKNDKKNVGQNPYVEGNSIIITPDQENLLRECGVLFTVVDRSSTK